MRRRVEWDWYRPEDAEERLALHKALEQRAGRSLDCPNLAEEPVLAAVVGRVNGKIRHVLFIEAEAEVQSGSAETLSANELAAPIAMLTSVLDHYRIRFVRAFVPNSMLGAKQRIVLERAGSRKPAIERMLTSQQVGFTREDPSLITQFYKVLPQAKGKTKTKAEVA